MLFKILLLLFPIIKIFYQKPKSFFDGVKLFFDLLLSVWIYLFLFFYYLTPIVYHYELEEKQIHIYTNQENYLEYQSVLQTLEKHLKSNILYDESLKINIQHLDSEILYKILNPFDLFVAPSYANAFNRNIIFHEVSLNKKEIYRYPNDSQAENITGVLLHEIIHVFQYNRYGILKMRFNVPSWVLEGYAEYSASPLMRRDTIENLKIVLSKDEKDRIPREKYILWGFMVKHAIEKMDKSVDDLHLGKVAYDEVLDSLLDEYNITKE